MPDRHGGTFKDFGKSGVHLYTLSFTTMSYRISTQDDTASLSGSSSSGVDTDDNCSDWASNFGDALKTKSLFDETVFPTPEEAIQHDKQSHGVDIREIKEKLGLDVYGLMRLVNLVRKEVGGDHFERQLIPGARYRGRPRYPEQRPSTL